MQVVQEALSREWYVLRAVLPLRETSTMPVSGQAGSLVAGLALLISLPVRATSAPLGTPVMWDLGVAAFRKVRTFAISPFCTAEQSSQVGGGNRVLEGGGGFSFVTPHWGVRMSQYLVAMIKCTTAVI